MPSSAFLRFFGLFRVLRRSIARHEAHAAKMDDRSGFIDRFWPGGMLVGKRPNKDVVDAPPHKAGAVAQETGFRPPEVLSGIVENFNGRFGNIG